MQNSSLRLCLNVIAGAGLVAALGYSVFGANHPNHSTNTGGKTLPVSAQMSVTDILLEKADRFTYAAAKQQSGEYSVLAHVVSASGTIDAAQKKEIARLGGHIYGSMPFINTVAVRVPRRNLTAVAALPFVSRLSADISVRKSDEFTVKATGADVAYANYGLTGSGVGVAVIDSGIERRPDLKGNNGTRIIATKDFINPNNSLPIDDCGHGTHIAGIIAGNGNKSVGEGFTHSFYGVARNANLINVRVLNEQGQGSVSDAISALEWVIQNKAKYNIRVVNLALGHPVGESYSTDPLCQAVEKAWKAGIVVVAAAGNFGRQSNTSVDGNSNEGYGTNYGSIHSPGNSPFAITVGAMKPFSANQGSYDAKQHAYDQIATYSSRGPSIGDLVLKPDIVAPGNRIISTRPTDGFLPTYFPNNQVYKSWYIADANATAQSKDYYILSGTSMAAPVVAGAAALLLEKNPKLTPDSVKARLMLSATKWTNNDGTTDPFAFGAGYLNIAGALQSNVKATGYAVSPTVAVQTAGTLSINTADASFVKGSLWGTGIKDLRNVWGTAFKAPTTFADPGNLWITASKLQGDIVTWGGDGSVTKTTTSNGGSVVWGDIVTWGGTGGTIVTWGGNGGNSAVVGTIVTWGGTGGNNTITGSIVTWGDGPKP